MREKLAWGFVMVAAALWGPPAMSQGAAGGKVDVLEVTVDPAFAPAFGKEVRLRIRVMNRGSAAAKSAAVEAKSGPQVVGRADLNGIGAGETRTLTLATSYRLGAGAACLVISPTVAPDSPVKPGASRKVCLTPSCYSLTDSPEP